MTEHRLGDAPHRVSGCRLACFAGHGGGAGEHQRVDLHGRIYDKHTGAKHAILRAYLDRWLPIMATHNRKLVLIDGFAGPGEYLGGEDGSPVVMLNAFLQHSDRERIGQRELVYVFVERHQGRFAHLRGVLDRLQLPPTISAVPVQGDFAHVMTTGLLDNLAGVPMFAFLDPFGFKANRLTLTTRILGFPHCEALISFPTRYLARFVGHPDTTDAFDLLYGGREWQELHRARRC